MAIKVSVLLFSGILISAMLTGMGIFVNDTALEYGVSGSNIDSLSKTAEFEAQVIVIKEDIINSDVDSLPDIVWAGFKNAPKIFQSFIISIKIFDAMIDGLGKLVGDGIATWIVSVILLLLMASVVIAVLQLFVRDRI